MTEREFIAKIHKALDSEIYKWKIHDAYHGGVPDAYYSGPAGCMFIEYKYHRKMPVRLTSKINTKTSSQQKLWLQRAIDHNVLAFLVIFNWSRRSYFNDSRCAKRVFYCRRVQS